MEKFMLIIREDLHKLQHMSYEERKANAVILKDWVESLTKPGDYVTGDALMASGCYVRQSEITSDGPFIESKEGVSGVIFFDAENIETVASFTKSCPLVLTGEAAIEVRPIMKFDF